MILQLECQGIDADARSQMADRGVHFASFERLHSVSQFMLGFGAERSRVVVNLFALEQQTHGTREARQIDRLVEDVLNAVRTAQVFGNAPATMNTADDDDRNRTV